ncbi:MAG: FGGY-family carbohydrate kinase, partial [Brevinema sp.]
MNYFLGIDIGSQSSKGVLVDENGKIIAKHSIPHQMDMPYPGHFEQDADRIWWGEFCEISRTLIKDSGVSPSDIKAVGHSATSPCVLFLDDQYKPLRPGILYGIDTRAHVEQEELTQLIGAKSLLETGGCSLSSQSVAPKIMWVCKNEPQVWKRTKKILSANGYISFKLTGRCTQNTYDAVGYTGLFNIFTMDWIDENLSYVCPKEYLPELVSPSQSIGGVSIQAAKECGLAVGTPVLPGIADAAAESLCAGVSQQREMMLMMGTSTFFILRTQKLHQTDKFWPSNFLKADEYVLTGGTSNCGSATTWFIDTFAKDTEDVYTVLLNEANEVETSRQSPLIVPYFAGERTPIFDPHAKAIFFGVTLNHKRGDLFRALLEGIAYTIKDNIKEIKELAPVEKIYAIGGGVKNPILLQLIADICQVEVIIPDIDIGAAYGDAYLAAC